MTPRVRMQCYFHRKQKQLTPGVGVLRAILTVLDKHSIPVRSVEDGVVRARYVHLKDYMDHEARDFCTMLARELYDEAGRSVYFDLKKGHLTLHY